MTSGGRVVATCRWVVVAEASYERGGFTESPIVSAQVPMQRLKSDVVKKRVVVAVALGAGQHSLWSDYFIGGANNHDDPERWGRPPAGKTPALPDLAWSRLSFNWVQVVLRTHAELDLEIRSNNLH